MEIDLGSILKIAPVALTVLSSTLERSLGQLLLHNGLVWFDILLIDSCYLLVVVIASLTSDGAGHLTIGSFLLLCLTLH